MPPSSPAKQFYRSENHFEKNYPYYRAVRHGNHIFVSGTTAAGFEANANANSDDGRPNSSPGSGSGSSVRHVLFPGNAYKQAEYALNEGIKAIKALGGKGISDVVRVRMFVSRVEDATAVGQAFKAMFGQTQTGDPAVGVAATMVIAQLVERDMLCEIEMDAVLAMEHL